MGNGIFDTLSAQPTPATSGNGVFDQIHADVSAASPAQDVADTSTSGKEEPGFLNRTSQAVLGTEHPWDQVKSEWDQLTTDPVGTLEKAAKTAAMMPVNLAYQAVVHPLDTSEQIAPVNRMIGDVKQKNYSGAFGDIAGGAINLLSPKIAEKGAGLVSKAADMTSAVLKNPADAVSAAKDFQQAIPATKSTPYTVEQYTRARPYLEAEHAESAIGKDAGITDVRDAADSAIGKIEDKIGTYIAANPTDEITTNPAADVKDTLSQNKRGEEFVNAGMNEIKSLNLDQPKTVAEADAIRRQLNLENQAALAKNNYKLEAARVSDPAFAAREAASQSLRDGIYGKLEQRGIQGVQDLRQDEGALISIRNAAQNQIFNGDKTIAGTASAGTIRKVAGRYVPPAVKAVLPEATFKPQPLTRNDLAARSFSKTVAGSPEYPEIPERPKVKGLLGTGSIVTPPPADTSGTALGSYVAYSPTTRAGRLGLLLGPKPGEPIVTPAPKEPLQLPAKITTPIVTPANLSWRDMLRMQAGKDQR